MAIDMAFVSDSNAEESSGLFKCLLYLSKLRKWLWDASSTVAVAWITATSISSFQCVSWVCQEIQWKWLNWLSWIYELFESMFIESVYPKVVLVSNTEKTLGFFSGCLT